MLATIEVAGCLCSNAEILMWKNYNDSLKRGRTTNREIGPVADQICEIWNCTIFVI